MKMVPLGEVIKPSGSRAGDGTTLPVYSVTKHRGFVPSETYFKKQVFGKDLSNYKKVRAGDFAYATIHLDEGSIGIAPTECLISPMYTVFSVDADHVVPDYLVRFMKSPVALAKYDGLGNGSVHRRRSISLKALSSLSVPLPPLDEQRRIATILDKADAIRQKRHQAIAHLDTLTRSIFRNTTRADIFTQSETVRFGELFKLKSGSFLPKSEQELGKFPVYGGNGITGMHREYLFDEPKIVIGRVGANCGAVHLTRPQSWITDNALYVDSTYRHFTDEYLVFLLRSLNLNQYANRSGQPSISANRLNDIEIQIPELKVQTEFAHLASFIEAQAESHKGSLEYFESLFESLQSRAFRGEL